VIGPGHGVGLSAAEVVAGAVVCPGHVGPPVDPAGVGVCSSTGEGLADEDEPADAEAPGLPVAAPAEPAGAVKIGVALELGPVPGSVALPPPPAGLKWAARNRATISATTTPTAIAPGAERMRSRKCQRGTVGPPVSHRRVGYPQMGGTAPDATRASLHLSHT
jgi:hypothetical protein